MNKVLLAFLIILLTSTTTIASGHDLSSLCKWQKMETDMTKAMVQVVNRANIKINRIINSNSTEEFDWDKFDAAIERQAAIQKVKYQKIIKLNARKQKVRLTRHLRDEISFRMDEVEDDSTYEASQNLISEDDGYGVVKKVNYNDNDSNLDQTGW